MPSRAAVKPPRAFLDARYFGPLATPSGRGRWLLGFAYQPLDALLAGQTLDLRNSALAFAAGGAITTHPMEFTIEPTTWLAEVQRTVKTWLAPVARHEPIELEVTKITLAAWHDKTQGYRLRYHGGLHERFLAAALSTLVEISPELRVCEDETCAHLFVRYRGQRFCSALCNGRVRSRRFAEKQG